MMVLATKKGHVIGHMICHISQYIILPPGWLDQPKDTCSCQRGQAVFEPRWSPRHKSPPSFLSFTSFSSLSIHLLSLPFLPFHLSFPPLQGLISLSADNRKYTPLPLFSVFLLSPLLGLKIFCTFIVDRSTVF